MRLLVDEPLQAAVAHRLVTAGHDTTHVRVLGLAGLTDDEVMVLAISDERVLVTTDTDLGTILALTGATGPSVLLLRGTGDTVDERVEALLDVLPRVSRGLSEGDRRFSRHPDEVLGQPVANRSSSPERTKKHGCRRPSPCRSGYGWVAGIDVSRVTGAAGGGIL